MDAKNLLQQKRAEDINYSLKFLSKLSYKIHEKHEKNKTYFKAFWFIISLPAADGLLKEKFSQKATGFFERNLKKLGIENYILLLIDAEIYERNMNQILSSLLLASPSGTFFIFMSNFKKKIGEELDEISIGSAKMFIFNDLVQTLSNENTKRSFLEILKKSIKK